MDPGRMMKDEKQETAEEPHMAASQGQVNQNRGVLCDDVGPDDKLQLKPEGLIVGGGDSIPFFRSFIDNLAPRYWGSIEGGCDSIPFFPSFVDNLAPKYWALPSDQELENLTSPDYPAPHIRDSSGQEVDDMTLEDMSEKLKLLYMALISSPESAAASVSNSSRTKLVTCRSGADGDAGREQNGVQFQYTPVTSAGGTSTYVHYPALHESQIPYSRVLQGEQVELEQEDKENDASSGFQSTRPLPLYVELEAPPIAHMQSGEVLCGDLDSDDMPECKRGGLIEGRSDSIPFFPSFHDNLGPRYRAELSEQQMATVPKLGDAMVIPDNAALLTPDSSRIGILQDLILDNSERDELTSIHKPLTTCSENAAGDGLINVPFTVRSKGVISCTPPTEVDASGEDNIFQYQWTPASSTGSTTPIPHTATCQLQERSSSRNLKSSTEKDLSEDDWDRPSSSRLSSKRVRPGMGSVSQLLEPATLQPRQVSRVPSYTSDDFEDIMLTVYAVKFKRVERHERTRMRISPYVSFSRSKILKTFRQWYSRLGLENPACSKVACHIFFQGYRMFQRSTWPPQMLKTNDCRLKLLMATAFWVAAKILETNRKVPTAERVASMANINAESLIHFELVLLDALRWQLVRSR